MINKYCFRGKHVLMAVMQYWRAAGLLTMLRRTAFCCPPSYSHGKGENFTCTSVMFVSPTTIM
jgi:hypothetical protein